MREIIIVGGGQNVPAYNYEFFITSCVRDPLHLRWHVLIESANFYLRVTSRARLIVFLIRFFSWRILMPLRCYFYLFGSVRSADYTGLYKAAWQRWSFLFFITCVHKLCSAFLPHDSVLGRSRPRGEVNWLTFSIRRGSFLLLWCVSWVEMLCHRYCSFMMSMRWKRLIYIFCAEINFVAWARRWKWPHLKRHLKSYGVYFGRSAQEYLLFAWEHRCLKKAN